MSLTESKPERVDLWSFVSVGMGVHRQELLDLVTILEPSVMKVRIHRDETGVSPKSNQENGARQTVPPFQEIFVTSPQ